MFTNRETRKEVFHCLITPSMDWGPALPEDRRKYSSSSERKAHPSGDTLGDDDVFEGGAELVDFKPRSDENNRLVHFEDETKKESTEGTKGQGQDKNDAGQGEEEKKEGDNLLNTDQRV